ncbi:MAG: N-acetylmuramoyl-L-alanine amidase [Nitrospirae bacterium]|nr:N-acetylmuramoyl-L-alanine amidase [Nitrospirota bacterium]
MKKTAFIVSLVFLLPILSYAETSLKLRAGRNPGSIRIVLEGPESVMIKGSVTQKGNDILVSFLGASISIQAESAIVSHSMVNKQTVRISPGDFSGIKVFTLKDPSRLVIDAYTKEEKGAAPPVSSPIKDVRTAAGNRTVVIDPGHGGYENGIVKDGNKEKSTVMDIARKLVSLAGSGASGVLLTRDSDRYMALGERVNFANSRNAEVFISLHIGNHRDIVIYTPVVTDRPSDIVKPYLQHKGQEDYEKETLTLLKAMSEAIIPELGEDMLSVKPGPYSIVSGTGASALIIELPSYEYASYDEEYKSKIANIIYNGLNIYEEAAR